MIKVLFVCHGNICRSPAAEAIMQTILEKKGHEAEVFCDSAGMSAYHQGEMADLRMREFGKKRGYDLLSQSRKFEENQDFEEFDHILVMDEQNWSDIHSFPQIQKYAQKVRMFTDFCKKIEIDHVPDPYYGGDRGFEYCFDIIEDACNGFYSSLKLTNA